jgi:hypothetical protein
MGPEGFVLPSPAIGQGLCLGHGGEQLGVEEFIPELTVELLGKTVLQWGFGLDLGRGGVAALVPAPERLSNELGYVVAANERRCRVEADELLKHGHHVLGFTAPAPPPPPDGWPGRDGYVRQSR